jgi:hypothetical protein
LVVETARCARATVDVGAGEGTAAAAAVGSEAGVPVVSGALAGGDGVTAACAGVEDGAAGGVEGGAAACDGDGSAATGGSGRPAKYVTRARMAVARARGTSPAYVDGQARPYAIYSVIVGAVWAQLSGA